MFFEFCSVVTGELARALLLRFALAIAVVSFADQITSAQGFYLSQAHGKLYVQP